MHGTALFNHACCETPMPVHFESDSTAEKKFNDLYTASLYGARKLRRVEAKGILRVSGDRYYLDVVSVDPGKSTDASL